MAVRLGPAIEWSDEDLERLSTVDFEDILAARILWLDSVPGPLRRLLDATVEEPEVGEQ